MVDSNKNFQGKYAKDILYLQESKTEQLETKQSGAERNVYLFFSFDIVNSTAYKALDYVHWAEIIGFILQYILEKVQSYAVDKIEGAKLWRAIGDELIFIVPVRDKERLCNYVDYIFGILSDICTELKYGNVFDSFKSEYRKGELFLSQNTLSLKSAAWIAIINNNSRLPEPYDCFSKHYKLSGNNEIIDFMGNDIDAGFRIKQLTQIRRLVVSYELAYFLSEKSDCQSNLHIIAYKQLKGIWEGHYYPVIWYYNEQYSGGTNFDNSFFFDEAAGNELVNEYLHNKNNFLSGTNVYTALRKICEDLGFAKKLEFIEKIIRESHNEELALETKFLLKLHCVAVCCDFKKGRILIAKRNSKRKKLPNFWEFGCAKAVREKSIVETLQEEYMSDFNVKIKVICDESRDDKQPVPLAIYKIGDNSEADKGIITIAEVIGEFDIKTARCPKHEELRWIKENEIDNFKGELVSDFKDTLHKAFEQMRRINSQREQGKKWKTFMKKLLTYWTRHTKM